MGPERTPRLDEAATLVAREQFACTGSAGADLPRLILEYRELQKLKGTYVDALPQRVVQRVRSAPLLRRRLLRRPVAIVAVVLTAVSMGVLTYKGATAKEASAGALQRVPEWIQKYNLPANAREGAEIFAVSGCLNCHTYAGEGASQLGAPDLTEEGTRNRGIQWQIDHLKAPSSVTPGSPMPSFAKLGEENLRKLAIFLEASKGESGGG